MKKQRVLVLMHPDLVPPDNIVGSTRKERSEWMSLYDVMSELRKLGHEVASLGVQDSIDEIRNAVREFEPTIVFNLLEEFYGRDEFDLHVVALLELLKVPYTGCNPTGMVLTRSKELTKKLLTYDGVRTPGFFTVARGRKPRRPAKLEFPLMVKSLTEDASLGISQASVVDSEAKLAERVEYIHDSIETDALVEQYIEGREIYVGFVGNKRPLLFPPWELLFKKLPAGHAAIATARIKHDWDYQKKVGIVQQMVEDLPPDVSAELERFTRRSITTLELDGYGRLDYRLDADNRLHLLEANANPDIGEGEQFAACAETADLFFPDLLEKIMTLGLSRAREHGWI